MDKFDEMQKEGDLSSQKNNKTLSRKTSLFKSYWFNMNDNEKLDFNQEIAATIIEIIEDSLNTVFVTWKDFNDKMKEDNKLKLKVDLKTELRKNTET